jgi:hypothetical protein
VFSFVVRTQKDASTCDLVFGPPNGNRCWSSGRRSYKRHSQLPIRGSFFFFSLFFYLQGSPKQQQRRMTRYDMVAVRRAAAAAVNDLDVL